MTGGQLANLILVFITYTAFCDWLSQLLAPRRPEPVAEPAPTDQDPVVAHLNDMLAENGIAARAQVITSDPVGKIRDRVLSVLHVAGRPMAAEEVADVLGGISHHTITPRLSDLEQLGLVVRTDERHQNRSGKSAVRFRISEFGDAEALSALEKIARTAAGDPQGGAT